MDELRNRLDSLNKVAIIRMAQVVNGGRVGYDPARVSKAEMIDRILLHDDASIVQALETIEVQQAAQPVAADPAAADPAAALAAAVQALAAQVAPRTPAIDVAAVEAIVDARMSAAPGMRIDVQRIDGTSWRSPPGTRPEFETIVRRAAAGLNILLVGPAGCGKTTIARQVAEALGRQFATVSCTAGMSESALQGWLVPGTGGEFQYLESDFVRLFEAGGVFLFDEIDAADANTLLFVNQALANGAFCLPMRKGSTLVKKHPEFVAMAAANTFGTGATATYAGRERLDESTLDRFRAGTVMLGYDAALEHALVDPALLSWGLRVREGIERNRLQRVMSTRFLIDATRAMRAGETLAAMQQTYFIGWRDDERRKAESSSC